jgi:3-phenylpropionate/trans-cinnamate dioxygenase ferredoxin reductase subunit
VTEASAGPLPRDGSVVVVGAGLGGLRAAEALREGGFGGSLVMVGEEPHPPYDRPPLSKQVLSGAWPAERLILADDAKLADLGVEHRFGHRAISFDAAARRIELDDGSELRPDAVVLATGAHPRPLPGAAGDGVLMLRTLEDAAAMRRHVLPDGSPARVVVVGAGFIGSEVAATCAGLGCDVTVVEAAATPLSLALGEEVGRACGAMHPRNGVSLLTSAGVTGLHDLREGASGGAAAAGSGDAGGAAAADALSAGASPRYRVDLATGSSLDADAVVVGIGVVPNVEWLEGSGLELVNGVVCDQSLFAADGVVVVGDMARWRWRRDGREDLVRIEHWQVAADSGAAAARSLLAGRDAAPAFQPIPYFWSDQYGLKIQMLGHPEPDDEVAVVEGSLDEERFVVIYGKDGRLTGVLGIGRPRHLMSYRPLLAAGSSWDDALAHTFS